MFSVIIILLSAEAITDVVSREITRPKRHSYGFEKTWEWSYIEETFPTFNENSSFSFTLKFLPIPELKLINIIDSGYYPSYLTTESPSSKSPSANENTHTLPGASLVGTNIKHIPTPSTLTRDTRPTEAPFTSRLVTEIPDPATIPTIETITISPPTFTTEQNPIDLPSIPTTSEKSTEILSTSTIEPVFSSSSQPELRFGNTTQEILTKTETTVASKTESMSISPTTNDNSLIETTTEPIDDKTADDDKAGDNKTADDVIDDDKTIDEEKTTIATPSTTTTPPSTTPSFCSSSYEPPAKPQFKAPGKRISENKCDEFIWELKNRKTRKDQAATCKKYIRRKWGGNSHGVGGRATKPGEFPHMGALGWKAVVGSWVFKCGSFLVSDKFVLTAAHCTKGSSKDTAIAELDPKIVRIGDKSIIDRIAYNSAPRQDAMISRIIIHPKYKAPIQYFDIALIELDQVVEFSRYVQPACLWNRLTTNELGKEAIGTGWGVIESGSLFVSPELQAVTVDVLETELCDKLLNNSHNRNWKGFHDDQLCAGKLAGGVDSCQGDSGGPLQIKIPLSPEVTNSEGSMHFVIGIISFGVGCAHPNLPGVYTRVSSFIDWIEENVWPDEKI